jgi:hypothetical protein
VLGDDDPLLVDLVEQGKTLFLEFRRRNRLSLHTPIVKQVIISVQSIKLVAEIAEIASAEIASEIALEAISDEGFGVDAVFELSKSLAFFQFAKSRGAITRNKKNHRLPPFLLFHEPFLVKRE